ncbi:MAG: DUF2059 domain-containing protein, partial [Pseudomonadales bacterium]
MKKTFIATSLALLLSCNSFAADGVSDAKRVLIDQLLEQTGQSATVVAQQFSGAFILQMTKALKQARPDLEPRAFTLLEEEVNALIAEEMSAQGGLMSLMYPIYARHFTEVDLQQMIAFNKTPLGQKVIRVMPLITQEGMQAGQRFGLALGPKIQ